MKTNRGANIVITKVTCHGEEGESRLGEKGKQEADGSDRREGAPKHQAKPTVPAAGQKESESLTAAGNMNGFSWHCSNA